MSDILKVTTPLVNKNQPVNAKAPIDPTSPFTVTDPTRIIRTHNQRELLKQNTGTNENSDAPVLLMNLLKDPAVAVTYLKNIFLLEEIFKLLPANNKTVTTEIEQIFQTLITKPDDIKKELSKQENASTIFKGPLFDFLRDISKSRNNSPATQYAIATLLKSINHITGKPDILDAIANSLSFLSKQLTSSKELTTQLDSLMGQFRQDDVKYTFSSLKEQTLALLKAIEGSILFTPKQSKVVSIIIYNLSRYNDSATFFNESAFRLRRQLTADEQKIFLPLLNEFSAQVASGAFTAHTQAGNAINSNVMNALIELVMREASNEDAAPTDTAKIDKILHSLLSSPCNFTPLLHFIIPVVFEDVRAFAEVWVNPESDAKDMPDGVSSGKHFLFVIDIDGIGRFEAELFSHKQIIDFFLFCPPGYDEKYRDMMDDLPNLLKGLNYKLGQTKLETLTRDRSLMDVFKSLPYKRVGVDVKI